MTAVASGWWKRRWIPRRRSVEYHFLPESEAAPEWRVDSLPPAPKPTGRAACGVRVGMKRPSSAPKPWTATATFAGVARLEPCSACVKALEGGS